MRVSQKEMGENGAIDAANLSETVPRRLDKPFSGSSPPFSGLLPI